MAAMAIGSPASGSMMVSAPERMPAARGALPAPPRRQRSKLQVSPTPRGSGLHWTGGPALPPTSLAEPGSMQLARLRPLATAGRGRVPWRRRLILPRGGRATACPGPAATSGCRKPLRSILPPGHSTSAIQAGPSRAAPGPESSPRAEGGGRWRFPRAPLQSARGSSDPRWCLWTGGSG